MILLLVDKIYITMSLHLNIPFGFGVLWFDVNFAFVSCRRRLCCGCFNAKTVSDYVETSFIRALLEFRRRSLQSFTVLLLLL